MRHIAAKRHVLRRRAALAKAVRLLARQKPDSPRDDYPGVRVPVRPEPSSRSGTVAVPEPDQRGARGYVAFVEELPLVLEANRIVAGQSLEGAEVIRETLVLPAA